MDYYYDKKYHFSEGFDPHKGLYIRSEVDSGPELGKNPFMRSFPNLMDIGIMGHCEHGKSGLCAMSGVECYQNGQYTDMPNMSFEDYKRIVTEGKEGGCMQIALGGRGDPDMHKDFADILRFTRENGIVPNFTTSGLCMTEEKAKLCKRYCGAVAVSWYSRLMHTYAWVRDAEKDMDDVADFYHMAKGRKYAVGNSWDSRDEGVYIDVANSNNYFSWHEGFAELNGSRYPICDDKSSRPGDKNVLLYHETNVYTYRAVKYLLDAGVSTNIHYVLSKNSIREAIIRLKYKLFPLGINAVIFLLHKPVGQGSHLGVLKMDDPDVKEFFEIVDTFDGPFKIGFDSCSVAGILNFCKNINHMSVDTCEGGRFSMYISSDMIALPCSFDNVEQRWGFDLSEGKTVQEAWDSRQFDEFREHLRNSCPDCPKRTECMGGCPICPEIVLCDR